MRGTYANTKRKAPGELYFEYVRTNSAADPFGEVFVNRLTGNSGSASTTYSDLDENLWAGGADLTYRVSPSLAFTAGGAYSDTQRYNSRRDFIFRSNGSTVCDGTTCVSDPVYLSGIGTLRPDALLSPGVVNALGIQLVVSVRRRSDLAVPVGDPWDGHSLEWWTPAPPPEYNFARRPRIEDTEAFTNAKRDGRAYHAPPSYEDIEVPRNTLIPAGIGAAGFVCAFALSWHIWWAALLGLAAMWAGVVLRSLQGDTERVIPAAEVQRQNEAWLDCARQTAPVTRFAEVERINRGRAMETT